jgi:hypothetical protein
MTPNDSIAIILFLLYCLAVHIIHLTSQTAMIGIAI